MKKEFLKLPSDTSNKHLLNKMLWTFSTLFLASSLSTAAPSISSISGVLMHKGFMTIQGSGFGTHEDFHADTDKLIRVWDDFESGNFTGNGYATWSTFNSAYSPTPTTVVRNSPNSRHAAGDQNLYHRNNVNLGQISVRGQDHKEYFVSHWVRLSDQYGFNKTGDTQWKLTRLYSTNGVDVYPGYRCENTIGKTLFGMGIEYPTSVVQVSRARTSTIFINPQLGWHRWDLYLKKSSSPSSYDGKLQVYIDDKLIYDYKQNTGDPYYGGQDYNSKGGDFAGSIAIGSYFAGATAQTYVDYDDIYISHTLARIELGNAPTWNACTHSELQIPQAWADGSIRASVNQGTFRVGETAYLFIFDASGNASPGYPVVIKSGATSIITPGGAHISQNGINQGLQTVSARIFKPNGKLLRSFQTEASSVSARASTELTTLPIGFYMLEVKTDAGTTVKIINSNIVGKTN